MTAQLRARNTLGDKAKQLRAGRRSISNQLKITMTRRDNALSQDLLVIWQHQLQSFLDSAPRGRRPVASASSVDEILTRLAQDAIRANNPSLLEEQSRVNRAIELCDRAISRIDELPWFRRWIQARQRKCTARDLKVAEQRKSQIETDIARATTALSADPALIKDAATTVKERNRAIAHNDLIDKAEMLAKNLDLLLAGWHRSDAEALELSLAESVLHPSSWSIAEPANAIAELHRATDTLTERFGQLARHRSAVNEATAVFNAARKFGLSKNHILDSAHSRAVSSLSTIVKDCATLSSLEEALERCIDPKLITSPDLWLTLWNAVEATRWCAKTYAPRSAEDAGTEQWCTGWENQVKTWSARTLECLGIGHDTIRTALLRTHGVKAETSSGADVILLLLVELPDRRYCKALGLQFKRSAEDASLQPLRSDQYRQFATLARLYRKSEKRWTSLYPVLRPGAGVLDFLPTVPIGRAIDALSKEMARGDSAKHSEVIGSVDWAALCEPLATAIIRELDNGASTFDTCSDAFKWYQQETGDSSLPAFFLVQSIGLEPELMRDEVRELRASARQRGIELREAGRDHSLSLGR